MIAGSNPAGAWMSVSGGFCVLSDVSARADLSPRGILPSVCVSLSVIKEPHRGGLVPLGMLSRKKKTRGVL